MTKVDCCALWSRVALLKIEIIWLKDLTEDFSQLHAYAFGQSDAVSNRHIKFIIKKMKRDRATSLKHKNN